MENIRPSQIDGKTAFDKIQQLFLIEKKCYKLRIEDFLTAVRDLRQNPTTNIRLGNVPTKDGPRCWGHRHRPQPPAHKAWQVFQGWRN